MTGVAIAITRAVKIDVFLHVQEQLGELLGYLQLIEAAILMSEQKAEPTGRGSIRPAYAPLQALRYHLPKLYERMVQVTQVLGAGGLLINPTEADLRSEIGPDIARYYRGAGVDAEERIRLFKLAWDVTGTQFGQRMLQYERYYAGDPVRVGAGYYLDYDVAPLLAQVQRALKRRYVRLDGAVADHVGELAASRSRNSLIRRDSSGPFPDASCGTARRPHGCPTPLDGAVIRVTVSRRHVRGRSGRATRWPDQPGNRELRDGRDIAGAPATAARR